MQVGLLSLHVVENVAIEGLVPNFLRPGQPRTAGAVRDEQALVAGLRALADHFGLFEQRAQRRLRSSREEDLAVAEGGG
jgi:hypothetical protein